MIQFDDVTKENMKGHNPDCLQIPDHPFKTLIIRGSGFGKTNALLNLISHHPGIDKIYLYTKYQYEAKYQLLINKCKTVGLKNLNDSKAFTKYSNVMGNIYENIEEYNPDKILFSLHNLTLLILILSRIFQINHSINNLQLIIWHCL